MCLHFTAKLTLWKGFNLPAVSLPVALAMSILLAFALSNLHCGFLRFPAFLSDWGSLLYLSTYFTENLTEGDVRADWDAKWKRGMLDHSHKQTVINKVGVIQYYI